MKSLSNLLVKSKSNAIKFDRHFILKMMQKQMSTSGIWFDMFFMFIRFFIHIFFAGNISMVIFQCKEFSTISNPKSKLHTNTINTTTTTNNNNNNKKNNNDDDNNNNNNNNNTNNNKDDDDNDDNNNNNSSSNNSNNNNTNNSNSSSDNDKKREIKKLCRVGRKSKEFLENY